MTKKEKSTSSYGKPSTPLSRVTTFMTPPAMKASSRWIAGDYMRSQTSPTKHFDVSQSNTILGKLGVLWMRMRSVDQSAVNLAGEKLKEVFDKPQETNQFFATLGSPCAAVDVIGSRSSAESLAKLAMDTDALLTKVDKVDSNVEANYIKLDELLQQGDRNDSKVEASFDLLDRKVSVIDDKILEVDQKVSVIDVKLKDLATKYDFGLGELTTKFDDGIRELTTKYDASVNELHLLNTKVTDLVDCLSTSIESTLSKSLTVTELIQWVMQTFLEMKGYSPWRWRISVTLCTLFSLAGVGIICYSWTEDADTNMFSSITVPTLFILATLFASVAMWESNNQVIPETASASYASDTTPASDAAVSAQESHQHSVNHAYSEPESSSEQSRRHAEASV